MRTFAYDSGRWVSIYRRLYENKASILLTTGRPACQVSWGGHGALWLRCRSRTMQDHAEPHRTMQSCVLACISAWHFGLPEMKELSVVCSDTIVIARQVFEKPFKRLPFSLENAWVRAVVPARRACQRGEVRGSPGSPPGCWAVCPSGQQVSPLSQRNGADSVFNLI